MRLSTNPRDTRRRHLPVQGLAIKPAVEPLRLVDMRVPDVRVLHLLADVFGLHHPDFISFHSWNEERSRTIDSCHSR